MASPHVAGTLQVMVGRVGLLALIVGGCVIVERRPFAVHTVSHFSPVQAKENRCSAQLSLSVYQPQWCTALLPWLYCRDACSNSARIGFEHFLQQHQLCLQQHQISFQHHVARCAASRGHYLVQSLMQPPSAASSLIWLPRNTCHMHEMWRAPLSCYHVLTSSCAYAPCACSQSIGISGEQRFSTPTSPGLFSLSCRYGHGDFLLFQFLFEFAMRRLARVSYHARWSVYYAQCSTRTLCG